jgi:uncharacterized protein Yka (UPF0111/DUF47 family)
MLSDRVESACAGRSSKDFIYRALKGGTDAASDLVYQADQTLRSIRTQVKIWEAMPIAPSDGAVTVLITQLTDTANGLPDSGERVSLDRNIDSSMGVSPFVRHLRNLRVEIAALRDKYTPLVGDKIGYATYWGMINVRRIVVFRLTEDTE